MSSVKQHSPFNLDSVVYGFLTLLFLVGTLFIFLMMTSTADFASWTAKLFLVSYSPFILFKFGVFYLLPLAVVAITQFPPPIAQSSQVETSLPYLEEDPFFSFETIRAPFLGFLEKRLDRPTPLRQLALMYLPQHWQSSTYSY